MTSTGVAAPSRSLRPSSRPRWWVTPLRVGLLVTVSVVVVALLWDRLPSPSQIAATLASAQLGWVAAAVALQLMSTGLFARQQHRLLTAFGVDMSVVRVGAITYSSTAIANSMPAGAAVSAGWSLRQFRARGAPGTTAVTVTLLSGALSMVGLLLLGVVDLLATSGSSGVTWAVAHPAWTAAIAIAVAVAVFAAIGLRRARAHPPVPAAGTPRLDRYQADHPRLGAAARDVLELARETHQVRWTDWSLALAAASGKWVLDAACLYAACQAFDVGIDPLALIALYLGVQVLRQIPLTPGGIGVIEVALLTGLAGIGAAEAPATAAVLLYRLVGAWMMIPLGYLVMVALTAWDRRNGNASQADAEVGTGEENLS